MTEPLHIQSQGSANPRRDYFRHAFARVILGLWALFMLLVIGDIGFYPQKIFAEVAKYGAAAYTLLEVYSVVIQHYSRLTFLLNVVHVLQLGIVTAGIHDHQSALIHIIFSTKDRVQLTQEIIKEVGDSTAAFRLGIDEDDLYRDCQGVGARIRDYRSGLFTEWFQKEKILARDTLKYIASVDSALGDPMSDACQRAGRFGRMLAELGLLIPTKNVDALDDFFRSYNISPMAKATEVRDGIKISKGYLRNYLIDAMQKLVPTFKEVRAPVYSPDGIQIIKLIFTT